MGKTGREFVLSNFSWPIIVEKYTNFIKEVVERNKDE